MALPRWMVVEGPNPRLLEASTLWDFPWRDYGPLGHGDGGFHGATPAPVAWNLIRRFTDPGDVILDCFAGSGTIVDVAREEGRWAVGIDVEPQRADILRADARHLPVNDGSVDLVVADPPYGDNIRYSQAAHCIGLHAAGSPAYLESMERVLLEMHRVLRPGGHAAVMVADEYREGTFTPLGFQVFALGCQIFLPVDIVCVPRRNGRTNNPEWQHRARSRNFFLRGFEYLSIFRRVG